MIKRITLATLRALAFSAFIFSFSLIALELLYRYQIVDTYLPELRSYNAAEVLADTSKPTILALGDSYTASFDNSYIHPLRSELSEYRIINVGIPGSGIYEALLLAPKRLKEFAPSIVIYQVYVGNDLQDIAYPLNWREMSLARNLYFLLGRYFKSLPFLNYRLGQITILRNKRDEFIKNMDAVKANTNSDQVNDLSAQGLGVRLYKAAPTYNQDVIFLKNARRREFEILLEKLRELSKMCTKGGRPMYIVIVPHSLQVGTHFFEYVKIYGAEFTLPIDTIQTTDYPFAKKIEELFDADPMVQVINPMHELKNLEEQFESNGSTLYYSDGAHLNRTGQKFLASYVADRIPKPKQ